MSFPNCFGKLNLKAFIDIHFMKSPVTREASANIDILN